MIDPSTPIDLLEDFIYLSSFWIFSGNVRFPSTSEMLSLHGCLSVVKNILSQKFLEIVFSNQTFEISKELKAFFIGNFTKSVVRRSTFCCWVEGRINISQIVVDHVSVH